MLDFYSHVSNHIKSIDVNPFYFFLRDLEFIFINQNEIFFYTYAIESVSGDIGGIVNS